MKNRKRIENISLIIIVVIILLIPVYLVKENVWKLKNSNQIESPETFVGRDACIQCHAKEYESWKGSDHDRAMEHANDTTVLGDFNNAELVSNSGITHKFYKKDKKFFVFTDGENGKMQELEIK